MTGAGASTSGGRSGQCLAGETSSRRREDLIHVYQIGRRLPIFTPAGKSAEFTDAPGPTRAYAGPITRRECAVDEETEATADELEALDEDDPSLGDAAPSSKAVPTAC